ncbi:MAG: ABC transporter permease, partial [Pirellulaceae bacterium]|nr:ABC transporter permease [Pirellulaceae bacterium]
MTSSPFAVPLGWWGRVDRWLERAGERLNPILVKEARQALKSRQFVITFGLLLICGLGWSLIGVAMLMPGIYYAASGPFMLIGYAIILTVPMLLIVPFSAYRSLAGEREDGTYELLSITTLSSRQIVTGKLGSAVLQMLVYYSALSPCIAFTYLLRGVDVVTLGLILFYTFLASVLLSAVGLLVATLSRARHVQVLLSVALLLGLAF